MMRAPAFNALLRAVVPVVAFAIAPAFASPGGPGPYTWVAGYTGGFWTNAGNWDMNPFYPVAGADVTLPASSFVNLNIDTHVASLTTFPGWYLTSSVGVHVLTVDNAITLNGGASANYLQDVAIISNGATTWNAGEVYNYYGASFTNNGTFEINSDNSWALGTFPAPAFTNSSTGSITKKAGTGTSTIQATLRNFGTVRADVGTLHLNGDGVATSNGTYISTADGTVSLQNMVLTNGSSFTGFGGVSKLVAGNTIAGNTAINFSNVQVTGSLNTINGAVSVDGFSALELTGSGGLNGSGSVNGAGRLLFTGGTLYGSSSSTFTINAQLVIDGTALKYIQEGTITNAGVGTWSGGDIATYYSPTLNNTGTLNVTGNNALSPAAFPVMNLNNTGTLRKTAGGGTTSITAAVKNTGFIIADSGTLSVTSDAAAAASTGTFTSNPGGSVLLNGFNLGTGAKFTGAGASQLGAGNTISGNVQLSSARVQVTGGGSGTNNVVMGVVQVDAASVFELGGGLGYLGGTGSINGPGTFAFSTGTLYGAPGTTLTVNAPMVIDTPGYKYIQEMTLHNAGNATWADGAIFTYYGPTLDNSGSFDITGDNVLGAGAFPVLNLNNTGNIRKSGGTGVSSISAAIKNTGGIVADAGILSLTSDAAAAPSTGSFSSNTGGTLQLTNFNLASGATFGGNSTTELVSGNTLAGNVTVLGGATLGVAGGSGSTLNANAFNGVVTLAAGGTLRLTALGAIHGAGSIQGPGTFAWTGGAVFGSTLPGMTLTNLAPMVISGADYKYLQEGSFTNAGSAVWSEGFILTYYAPTFRNTGTFDIQGDVTLTTGAYPDPIIVNTGVLKKTAGAGVTTLNGDISSSATGNLRLETGTTNFTGTSFSSLGFFTLLPGANVQFSSAATTIGGVHTWPTAYPLATNGVTTFLTDSTAVVGSSELDIMNFGSSLTFASTHHLTGLTIYAGTVTVSGDHSTLHTKGLTFAGLGLKVDLTNDALMLHYTGPTPVDDVRGHLLAGRIMSSVADPNDIYSIGYRDLGVSVLARFTYHGDANLNGKVDLDDFALIDRGFLMGGAYWTEGDFNYDGVVTSADYLLIDRTYALQGSPLSAGFLAMREGQFGSAYVSELLASIPEPSATSGVVLSSLLVARRRRRMR